MAKATPRRRGSARRDASGRRATTARVAFARISFEQRQPRVASGDRLFDEPPVLPVNALRQALVAGQSAVRYGKTWRLTRWTEDNGYIFGRVGFERETGQTELWDEKTMDFEPAAVRQGQTSPFAIRLNDFRVAFQLRTAQIERGSFAGALRSLLTEGSPRDWTWHVEVERLSVPWEQWVERIDRLTKLTISVHPPNPNYQGKDKVEDLLEGSGAKLAKIIVEAESAGIDLSESELIKEFLEYADSGYGKWTAEGVLAQRGRADVKTKWASEDVEPARDVPATSDTHEATSEGLRLAIAQGTPELTPRPSDEKAGEEEANRDDDGD